VEAYFFYPYMPSWSEQGKFYLYPEVILFWGVRSFIFTGTYRPLGGTVIAVFSV
jgi:hypothetical protein